MPFSTLERSHASGRPVELYDFYQGSVHWRYTNADREITYNGATWTPVAISRDRISQSPEMSKIGLKVTADRTLPIYERFRIAPPGSPVGLTVYTFHYGDADANAQPEWSGVIMGCVRKGSEVVFAGEPMYASVKGSGLRRAWQRQCPHLLYGPGCKVVKESFAVPGKIQTIAGTKVTLAVAFLYPDFYFEGGYMQWNDDLALPLRRDIIEHIGGNVTLGYTLHDLVIGQTVLLYPGCDHTTVMCGERFNNLSNFGGTPYLPEKNPYAGQAVY